MPAAAACGGQELHLKKYFITGLLIWLPLAITYMVISWIVGTLDAILLWLPEEYQPSRYLGVHIPGVGVIAGLLLVFFTGLVAANVIGQKLVKLWEALLARIPVVKSIYYSVKQVSDTLFSSSGEAFRKALLSEKDIAASQGVYNFTETDRYGTDDRSRIILTVKNGKYEVVK